MRSIIVIGFFFAVTGCTVNRDIDPPSASYIDKRQPDPIASCYIAALNKQFNGVEPIRHEMRITDPGREFEILPQARVIDSGDVYVIRLTKIPEGTRVEAFVSDQIGFRSAIMQVVTACKT